MAEDEIPPVLDSLDTYSAGPPQYEFTPAQERLIGDLGRKMRFVGSFLLVTGLLALVSTFVLIDRPKEPGDTPLRATALFFAICAIVIGLRTRRAGRGFTQIAATERKDITHLMEALAEQRSLFRWLYVLLILIIAAMVLMLMLGLVFSPEDLAVRVGGRRFQIR